jgi:hypothetical protein
MNPMKACMWTHRSHPPLADQDFQASASSTMGGAGASHWSQGRNERVDRLTTPRCQGIAVATGSQLDYNLHPLKSQLTTGDSATVPACRATPTIAWCDGRALRAG